jgi:adenylate cyclase, class 2
MGKEYEVQIIDVNIPKMRKILKKHNGKKVHKNLKMVRAVFDTCNSKIRSFARVRYEGKNTTMTVKVYNNKKFPDEYEVSINEDFESGKKFLEALNLKQTSYQETYREKWSLPIKGVHEITFDTWPGLPPFMEIDCDNKKTLEKVIKLFNPDKNKITYGPVGVKYNSYYGINILRKKISSLTFKNVQKELEPKKNKDLFKKVITQQKKKYVRK